MTEVNRALVSIIIRAYNVERYIKEAIKSAMKQEFSELIICYDLGSSDQTFERVMEALKEGQSPNKKFKLVIHPHVTPFRSLLHGIINAKGDYIAFLDGDNIFPDNYIKEMLHFIFKTGSNFVFCKAKLIDEKGKDLNKILREIPRDYYNINNLFLNNFVDISTIIVSKNCFKEFLVKMYRILNKAYLSWLYEDWFMALLATNNHVINYNCNLEVKYRVHSSNITFGSITSFNKLKLKIKRIYKTLIAFLIADWPNIKFCSKFILVLIIIFTPLILITQKFLNLKILS